MRLVRAEVDEIANQTERERLLKSGWIDCFRPSNKTLYRTLLGMSLQSFQQLTGANYFFYYGATIFESVGINDSFVTQIILGAVNFVCTFGGLYVMERVRLYFLVLVYMFLTYNSLDAVSHLWSEVSGNPPGSSSSLLLERPRIRLTTLALENVCPLQTFVATLILTPFRLSSPSHDRQRVHVHYGICHDLGPWCMDSHWRDFPDKDSRQARGIVNC